MADLKTKPTKKSVKTFIDGIEDEQKRKDCRAIMRMMKEITGKTPKMWGDSIVGYGSYHYKYDSGREGDFFLTGLSPRKQAITVYVMAGFSQYDALMGRLGRHTNGKSCLYIKRLDDVDSSVLRQLIKCSVAHVSEQWS